MLVIAVCKSGLLASTIGGCSGKVSFFRLLYRLRLLSTASAQAPCLWLVARHTGDTLARSRDEKEIRLDSEHRLLTKGNLSGHQFEPRFEASTAELKSVGLGKTPRELYLSYLRKMPAVLQKRKSALTSICGHR